MKRTILYTLLALAAISCQNKDLVDPAGTDPMGSNVYVRINWADGLNVPLEQGMRINLFALDEGVAHYGKADVPYTGARVRLPHNTSHHTYAYNYTGNNVRFRNEAHPGQIEATTSLLSRTTYSRAFPDETTMASITGDMHVGHHPSYTVLKINDDQYIDVWPENIVIDYTFEVRGVEGAEFIRAARGAISGFSASHFMATGALAETPSTVLFDATVNARAKTITGSFRTFGRIGDEISNHFTIETLYPSTDPQGGIQQNTWDVTHQIDTEHGHNNTHIIIDNSGINIPDDGGGDDTGSWSVILGNWNDVNVPLN